MMQHFAFNCFQCNASSLSSCLYLNKINRNFLNQISIFFFFFQLQIIFQLTPEEEITLEVGDCFLLSFTFLFFYSPCNSRKHLRLPLVSLKACIWSPLSPIQTYSGYFSSVLLLEASYRQSLFIRQRLCHGQRVLFHHSLWRMENCLLMATFPGCISGKIHPLVHK